jgi:hypothetical protein
MTIKSSQQSILFTALISVFSVLPAAAAGITLSDLAGHSVELEYHDRGTYRYLDGSKEWRGSALISRVVYISDKKRIFYRITIQPLWKQAPPEVRESVVSLGQVTESSGNWSWSRAKSITSGWKFEDGALVLIYANGPFASRQALNFARAGGALTCTYDSRDLRVPGQEHVEYEKDSRGKPYERVTNDSEVSFCRVTEGNLLESH